MSEMLYKEVAFSIFIKKTKQEKIILEPMSGYVPNASLTAIMGPSGMTFRLHSIEDTVLKYALCNFM